MTPEPRTPGRFRVIRPGLATFQDLGRFGAEQYGLSVNGAADQASASAANLLVGNNAGDTLCEILMPDFEAIAESHALIAVTGADSDVTLDGLLHPSWNPIVIRPGQSLRIASQGAGARAYFAVNGGFAAERFAGSSAPDTIVGFDQQFAAGDLLTFDSRFRGFTHPIFGIPLFRLAPGRAKQPSVWPVSILPAPETDEVDDIESLLQQAVFTVGRLSNHVGLRLDGPLLRRMSTREIVSRGVPVGAIELPPSGEPIILMRGRFVTAGYPIVAVVTTASLSSLGQAAPGQQIRFQWQTIDDAVLAHRAGMQRLEELRSRVRTSFVASGLGEILAT